MATQTATPGVTYLENVSADENFAEEVQAALDRIERHVFEGESLDDVMDLLWDATRLILPRDRIGLAFVEKDGTRISARACRAAYEERVITDNYSAGLAQSSLKMILDRGWIRIIDDTETYLEHHPDSASTKLLLKEGIRSNITLPLKVKDRPVGVLFFSRREPKAFTEEHARILRAVLGRLAQAVEKAWTIKQLKDANEGYLSMLGFVSHELKSPLGSLIARGETYVEGYLGDVDPKAEETIRKMMRAAGYLLTMVNDYLQLARLEGGQMQIEPKDDVEIRPLLEFAIESVAMHASQRGSSIAVDWPAEEVSLRADPDMLRVVFINLLDNAVKYGYDNVEVNVSVRVEKDHCRITVRNPGVGFTPEQQAKLFRRFSRLRQEGTEDRKGTGLGLYMTFVIVQKHGGRLLATSEPGEWAEFTAKLPLAGPESSAS